MDLCELSVDMLVLIASKLPKSSLKKLLMLSRRCGDKMLFNNNFWEKLTILQFGQYGQTKPKYLSSVVYYCMLVIMKNDNYPMDQKPDSMQYEDFIERLLYSGDLYRTVKVYDRQHRDEIDEEYTDVIAQNICNMWMTDKYNFYIDIFGKLYAHRSLTKNAFKHYIETQSDKDYYHVYKHILNNILEIAPNNIQSALVLDTDHNLYGLGEFFNGRKDEYNIKFLLSSVSRVWSNQKGTKYYYQTDDSDIYMFDLMTSSPTSQLVHDVPVPPFNTDIRLVDGLKNTIYSIIGNISIHKALPRNTVIIQQSI